MKLRAPANATGPLSHAGQRFEIAEDLSIEVPDAEAGALAAHGFAPWSLQEAVAAPIDALSREDLIAWVMALTHAFIAKASTEDLRAKVRAAQSANLSPIDEASAAGVALDPEALAPSDIEAMSRAELFAYLRGQRVKVALPVRNEELRALARGACATAKGAR